jgi:hypothetical protein
MCPVCQARFRGSAECSRCGADLAPIMGLVASAWRLREAARQAIAAGDMVQARALAAEAQELCRTPAGRDLEMITSWLT